MSDRILRLAALIATLTALSRPAAAQDSARAQRPARIPSDMIVRSQMDRGTFATAYDIVEAIRGNWLRARPSLRPTGFGVSSADTSAGGSSGGTGTSTSTGTMAGSSDTRSSADRSPPGEDAGIQVYLDGSRIGGIEQLRSIVASTVVWIKHYDPIAAQARFGVGHSSGVIFVSTREGSVP